MSSRQLFLHIGRPKTGSSAIQHFLWTNRRALIKRGLLYPASSMHQRASHKLALVFQQWNPGYRIVQNITIEQVYADIFAEARKLGVSRILASSENLFIVDPAKVREQIPASVDTKIVCYVRRQDEVLVSSLLQEIKTGQVDRMVDVTEYIANEERRSWLDYASVLERWAAQFGEENIIVRVYEKEQLEGAIYQDMLAITGISTEGLETPTARINNSPALDILQFITMLNSVPELPPGQRPELRIPLLQLSERMGKESRFDGRRLIPVNLRRKVLADFEKSNARVARRFLHRRDGRLFLDDRIPDDAGGEAYGGLEINRFAEMIATLFGAQQRQIRDLKQQVQHLVQKLEQDIGTTARK